MGIGIVHNRMLNSCDTISDNDTHELTYFRFAMIIPLLTMFFPSNILALLTDSVFV